MNEAAKNLGAFREVPFMGVIFVVHEAMKRWSAVRHEHNAVMPDYSYLVNVFLDDGTENMRVVLFRNQAERLLGKTKEQMVGFFLPFFHLLLVAFCFTPFYG